MNANISNVVLFLLDFMLAVKDFIQKCYMVMMLYTAGIRDDRDDSNLVNDKYTIIEAYITYSTSRYSDTYFTNMTLATNQVRFMFANDITHIKKVRQVLSTTDIVGVNDKDIIEWIHITCRDNTTGHKYDISINTKSLQANIITTTLGHDSITSIDDQKIMFGNLALDNILDQ